MLWALSRAPYSRRVAVFISDRCGLEQSGRTECGKKAFKNSYFQKFVLGHNTEGNAISDMCLFYCFTV